MLLAAEESQRQCVLDVMQQEGLTPERICFVDWLPRQQYLKHYHDIDIGLDTLPYNGQTTSLDAFWMGVPVITLVGQTAAGRAGASQLINLGLPELIAKTPEEFVQIVADLGSDLPRLATLRRTLRDRLQSSPLMNARRFAANVEVAFRSLWQRWCATQKT